MAPESKNRDAEHLRNYKNQLDDILGRQLTPENIDTYADEALNDVVHLVEQATAGYNLSPTHSFETTRQAEEAALAYHGLGNVETILDHIADKADEIQSLDKFIADTLTNDVVYLPPDIVRGIVTGEGKHQLIEKEHIARLKTVLFVLANEFDVDIHDPEQLERSRGVLRNNMMRKESYYTLHLPGLKRDIMICDEEDNISFVFDDEKLEGLGVNHKDLAELSKSELKELIAAESGVGVTVRYSDNFVQNMIQAINNPSTEANPQAEINATYLTPKAPEGVTTIAGIAKDLGVTSAAVMNAMKELGEALGQPVGIYRFGRRTANGYSPDQQTLLQQYLEKKGSLSVPPADVFAAGGLAKVLGVSDQSVRKAVKQLGYTDLDLPKYKFGSNIAVGYSPDQQLAIAEYLEDRGIFANQPPTDYLSYANIAEAYGVDRATVERAIKSLGDTLGAVAKYRFANNALVGYSPDQQQLIYEALEHSGALTPSAPEDFFSVSGLAEKIGVSERLIIDAIEEVEDSLGEIAIYKFGSKPGRAFSPDQQEAIYNYLKDQGKLIDKMPEGFLTREGLSKHLGVDSTTIPTAIKNIGEAFGQSSLYRTSRGNKVGYSPEQQAKIKEYIAAKKSGGSQKS